MKTSARFLAMLLAVLMIAGAALSVAAFDDVAGNKHANAVNVLAQLGVIGGYEDGTFKPDQKVTRAEMAKLVYVTYTTFVEAGAGKQTFDDVTTEHWAAGYIDWCSQKNIIGGYGDGKFGPNDNVTYDQALKMVCGILGYTGFQSNLWPTDVRMTALRTLDLGEELDYVKGTEELTRAQVAQILYNALDEDMSETKINYVYDKNSYTDEDGNPVSIKVPMEVAKTLAVDVWKFDEVIYEVVGTENFGTTVKDNELKVQEKGKTAVTWKLADKNLGKYEGKTDALFGLEVVALKNKNTGDIISATVAGTVVDNVEVKYNAKEKTVLVIGGVDYSFDEKNALNLWNIATDTLTPVFVDALDNKNRNIKVVNSVIVGTDTTDGLIDNDYMARTVDVDGDGIVDRIVISGVNFYEVTNVKKDTNKTVEVKTIANGVLGSVAPSFKSADLTVAVEKGDVIAVADLGGIKYTTVVEAVETYATKLAADEITLEEVGAVEIYAGQFPYATKVLGEDNKAAYYIYNGKVIYADGISTSTEYKIAVLKDIVVKDEGALNPSTMKYETSYEAILIVDGEEITAPLSALSADTVLYVGTNAYNAATAVNTFASEYEVSGTEMKRQEADGSPVYPYLVLSSYEVNKDGEYTLYADEQKVAEDKVIKNAKLSYDADKGVYTVYTEANGANGIVKTVLESKIVIDDNSVVFYKYEEDKTGDFKHLGTYTAETLTDKSFTNVDLETIYLAYNKTNKTYSIVAALVSAEIEPLLDGKDYKNDGTLILYAPAGSSEVLKGEKYYFEHIFKNGLENEAVVGEKESKESTKTAAGKFYRLDSTGKYVEVDPATETLESFFKATLNEIFYTKNNVLEYTVAGAKNTDAIADDVVIWGLAPDEDGKTKDVYGSYKEITVADLAAMIEEAAGNNKTIEAYVVRTLNLEKSDTNTKVWDVKEIIVNIHEIDADTNKFEAINDNLFPAVPVV